VYGVQTVVNDGSVLLIFVLRATHSDSLSSHSSLVDMPSHSLKSLLDRRRKEIQGTRSAKEALLSQRARQCGRPRQPVTGKGGHHVSHINHHRGGRYTMNPPASITITPVHVADLLAEGERMPVYVHVIDHPDARVLVDTGMTELHPAVADLDPRLRPLSKQDFDVAGIDIVVNTHLHFDHCGGNHLFAGRPIYVQRRELDDARSEDDYTIREWVEAPGVRYVPVDGELELLPGLRLVPAPGHTRGMQVVVVETRGRPVVVGGDVAVWFGELDEPHTEGQLRVRALDPELVWLAHEHEPWRPRAV
jgi:N-acyl homoserine lactone hydrolase